MMDQLAFEEKKMNSEEILKVSRELIGSVYPVADSHYDEVTRINANKSYDIIRGLIADIGCMSCRCYDSPYGSVKECGENGYKILQNIKAEIEDYLHDIE